MRKVIVTGGSRGLGLAIVRRLICEGYGAIAVARQMNDQLASAMEDIEHPAVRAVLTGVLERLSSVDHLSRGMHEQVAGLHYALRKLRLQLSAHPGLDFEPVELLTATEQQMHGRSR